MTPSFLTDEVKAQIAAYCELTPDLESCGLVLNDGTVILSSNEIDGSGIYRIDKNGEIQELNQSTGALIDVSLYLENEDDIACFWHSHCCEMVDGYLSFTDIDQSRFHGIPYLLYHTVFKTWDYFDPNYYHPFPLLEKGNPKKIDYYKNWPFVYGRSDCSMLLRSYYRNIYDLSIPDYPRPYDGEWYKNPTYETAYQDLMKDPVNGFTQVNTSNPKKGDVILVRWFGSRHASHAGIMVDDDKVLHIIQNRLSEVVVYGGAWQKGLHSVWRVVS